MEEQNSAATELHLKLQKYQNLVQLIVEHAQRNESFTALAMDEKEQEEIFNRAFQELTRSAIVFNPIVSSYTFEFKNNQNIDVKLFDSAHVRPAANFGSLKGFNILPEINPMDISTGTQTVAKPSNTFMNPKSEQIEHSGSDLDALDVVDRSETRTVPLAANVKNQQNQKQKR